jgi:hypothetical protein
LTNPSNKLKKEPSTTVAQGTIIEEATSDDGAGFAERMFGGEDKEGFAEEAKRATLNTSRVTK